MKDILVIGGAGYIGSHMSKYLSRHGYNPIVLDNLVCGHAGAVKWGPFYEGAMDDAAILHRIFSGHQIAAVMHFAAFCYVGESVVKPARYYQNNVAGPIALLDFMLESKVRNFIFSSSCAIYGEPDKTPITEDLQKRPINPYGRTKLMVEQMLDDYGTAYGLRSVCLRYFNAAGADPEGELGEDHRPETHIIPLLLKTALGQRPHVDLYGDDYNTPDGTCIRDYIHIQDLAQAHLIALERLLAGSPGGKYNLGNERGYSVKEVVETARRVTGRDIPIRIVERRPGDPAILVSSSEKAIKELKWRPEFPEIEAIVRTAWRWHSSSQNGYS